MVEHQSVTGKPFAPFRAELAPTISAARIWFIILGAAAIAGPAMFFQVVAAVAQEVPGWHPWVIGVNAFFVVALGVFGMCLFLDTLPGKWGPRTVKVIGLALSVYALAQAATALGIVLYGVVEAVWTTQH